MSVGRVVVEIAGRMTCILAEMTLQAPSICPGGKLFLRFKDFNLYATCIPVRKPVAWQESTTLTLSTAERSQQVSIGAFVVPRRMAARFHQSRLFV